MCSFWLLVEGPALEDIDEKGPGYAGAEGDNCCVNPYSKPVPTACCVPGDAAGLAGGCFT